MVEAANTKALDTCDSETCDTECDSGLWNYWFQKQSKSQKQQESGRSQPSQQSGYRWLISKTVSQVENISCILTKSDFSFLMLKIFGFIFAIIVFSWKCIAFILVLMLTIVSRENIALYCSQIGLMLVLYWLLLAAMTCIKLQLPCNIARECCLHAKKFVFILAIFNIAHQLNNDCRPFYCR